MAQSRLSAITVGVVALLALRTSGSRAIDAGHSEADAGRERVRGGIAERVRSAHGRSSQLPNTPNYEPGGGMLDTNMWSGGTYAHAFRVLDDLEPVAPMDKVADATGEIEELPGSAPNNPGLYVPPYYKPDAFPVVHGPICKCTPAAAGSNRAPACTCRYPNHIEGSGKTENSPATYQWTKIDPVPGTSDYIVRPADPTYPNGDLFLPDLEPGHEGIVAPLDKMPLKHYPAQAPRDRIRPIPATAREDTIRPTRFVKYIDQVDAKSRECDKLSKACTTPCSPGDQVMVRLGNSEFSASITRAFVGNAVAVVFATAVPPSITAASLTKDCNLNDGCSAFRPCYKGLKDSCEEMRDVKTHNFAGTLVSTRSCPRSTTLCRSVEQVVGATFLRKGGTTCRAAPIPEPTPAP